jgi:hypothetical protein
MTNKMHNLLKRGVGKKLMIVVLALGLTAGASAQRHIIRGGGYYFRPAPVYVGVGFGYPFFPYYGISPWGYYPYSPYYYGSGAMPPRLAYQIDDIKKDYSDQISAVKADKSLTGKERRQRVRELKNARSQAIDQAKHDYYTNSRRPYNSNAPQPYKGNDGNNQQPSNQPLNNGKPQSNSQQQNSNSNGNEQPEYSER